MTQNPTEPRRAPQSSRFNLILIVLANGGLLVAGAIILAGCDSDVSPADPLPAANEAPCEECLCRADFGDPAESPYILPYPVAKYYRVGQSYCYENGGHQNQLSYDFVIPIGADIIAARGGVVMAVREELPDNGQAPNSGIHNHVLIQHDDGTVAFYAHLMQNGVAVEIGDTVAAGQRIAASGNSGLTGGPHLHLGVYQYWPPEEGDDVPFNFRNAEGPLDERGGLRHGATYIARSF